MSKAAVAAKLEVLDVPAEALSIIHVKSVIASMHAWIDTKSEPHSDVQPAVEAVVVEVVLDGEHAFFKKQQAAVGLILSSGDAVKAALGTSILHCDLSTYQRRGAVFGRLLLHAPKKLKQSMLDMHLERPRSAAHKPSMQTPTVSAFVDIVAPMLNQLLHASVMGPTIVLFQEL